MVGRSDTKRCATKCNNRCSKARSLFDDIMVNLSDPEAKFVVSNGWFHIF